MPLILWVDSMIESRREREPDTVHDKNLADDERNTAFLKYFGK
jgi:hypothetical protein